VGHLLAALIRVEHRDPILLGRCAGVGRRPFGELKRFARRVVEADSDLPAAAVDLGHRPLSDFHAGVANHIDLLSGGLRARAAVVHHDRRALAQIGQGVGPILVAAVNHQGLGKVQHVLRAVDCLDRDGILGGLLFLYGSLDSNGARMAGYWRLGQRCRREQQDEASLCDRQVHRTLCPCHGFAPCSWHP